MMVSITSLLQVYKSHRVNTKGGQKRYIRKKKRIYIGASVRTWCSLSAYRQWRMQDGDKEGLNNKDLGLELEINGDLRLNNRSLMKKSGSLWGL